jgi:hypothetical protein
MPVRRFFMEKFHILLLVDETGMALHLKEKR